MRKIRLSYMEWERICNYKKMHWRMCATCCFQLSKLDGDVYHVEALIRLPIFILLFIPASIIDAFAYMWDEGLKNFQFPSRWVDGSHIYPGCDAYDYCEVTWDAKNKG